MAINPNDITTVRVGQLPSEPFNLTDLIPHEVGTDLKQGTVQSLADFLGSYLSVSSGVGFRAVTVNDGETLPATTQQEFILVGPGTFVNVGGGTNITTTEELNALVSNGTYWFIGVEIPISAENNSITQFVRDGFTNTTPSEDAVFELTKNHIDDAIGSGAFVRTPGSWQALDLALGDQTNTLFRAVCNIGLVDVGSDAFNIARADDTHLNVTGTSIGIIFPNFFHTLPAAPNGSIKQVPTNTSYPLASLTGELPAVGTQGVYYLGWRDSTQAFETATTSFIQNPNVFHCGVIFLKNVGGVISFIDSTRTVITMPDVSQYSNLETTAIGVKSNVFISPNAGGMTVKNNAGSIVGLSVNYKGANNDEKAITLSTTTSFRRLNPGNANATSLPAATTTVSVTDYWNGTAMTALAANGNASVQRWLLTVMGTFILQPGEAQYTNFQEGKDNVYTATFTDIIPKGTFVEIGRMVAVKNATDLGNNTQAVFVGTGSSGSGGGSVSTVSFSQINGFAEDNTNLNNSLANKEDLSNKTDNVTGSESSTSKYPSLLGFTSWVRDTMPQWLDSKVTTLVDTDLMLIADGADSYKAKTRTFGQLKATLKTYFDGLYGDATTTTAQTISGVKTFLNGTIGLRNVANTFTSFFTNSNTASRTYTLPDKNGTVAMTSDLPTGTANYLLRFLTATTYGIGKLFDNGSIVGHNNSDPYVKNFEFGNDTDYELGTRQSASDLPGRNLSISAGNTVDFNESVGFSALGVAALDYYGVAVDIVSKDVFATSTNGGIYKQTGGIGAFVQIESISRLWHGIDVNPVSKDVYACVSGGDIYKQTGGIGSFIALGAGNRGWQALTINKSNGDVYVTVNSGDIYKQTGGSGSFVALSAGSRLWRGITVDYLNNDVYASVFDGDIYKQTGGAGSFVAMNKTSYSWSGIAVNSITKDLYAVSNGAKGFGLFQLRYGKNDFVQVVGNAVSYRNMCIDPSLKTTYVAVGGGTIYKRDISSSLGSNLNGGSLRLKAGTGKGTGQSRVEFVTGQKTASGTDMQAETTRGYFDEKGNFVCLNIPVYANDAAADADAELPSGAYYRITGSRILYQKP